MDEQKIEEKNEEKAENDVVFAETDAEVLAGLAPERVHAIEEMIRAGVLYGHKKSKTNPRFRPYIHTTRNNIDIIDIPQTLDCVERAAAFLRAFLREGKIVLVVATQPALRELAHGFAQKLQLPFIYDHWIGGLLTNFKVLIGRIEHWKKLKADLAAGRLDKYTKKERVMMQKDIDRMTKMFSGLENLSRLPDALFVIDTAVKGHGTAIREAKRVKIPLVGIIDNDDNPDLVDYPIPANDHARMSVAWILDRIDEQLMDSTSSPQATNNLQPATEGMEEEKAES